MLKITKAVPFGANFSTKLESANNKLVCALSSSTTCTDDADPPLQPWPPIRRPWDETIEETIIA